MALSTNSRFTRVQVSWRPSEFYVHQIFVITTDDDEAQVEFNKLIDHAAAYASDSNLGILRTIYANDGFLDADDDPITLEFNGFRDFPITPTTLSQLPKYGSFNPLDPDGYTNWLANDAERRGALIQEGEFTRDSETGRPRVESTIDQIPLHRRPDGTNFAYPLGDSWDVDQNGGVIEFTRNFTDDEAVTDPDEDQSVLAFLAWLQGLLATGDAVGTDVTALATFSSRTFDLDQGGDAEEITIEINSLGHFQDPDTNIYGHVAVSFQRLNTETDDIDIEAIRTLLLTATGSIPAADAQEVPEIGSTQVPVRASEIILPDDYRLGLHARRLALRHPSMGVFPLDGAHVRAVRFEDLDDITGVTNGKYMPNDGAAVVHFGHTATAHGILRYRNIADMVPSGGSDVVQRVHNVSEDYRCTLQDMDDVTLLVLQPFAQSGPMQVALEVGGENGEILALDPPDRRVVLTRGHSAPTFSNGTSYPFLNNGVDDHYQSLRVQPNALKFQDTDGWHVGSDADPTADYIGSILPSNFDIRGSYQILRPGWVSIALRYRLVITDPAPTGELARGNGPSLWISEGGGANFVRDHTSVAEAMGGTGGRNEYHLDYYDKHEANTRFLLFHYIPNASTIAESNYDHIDQEAFSARLILSPEIRKTVTL